MVRKEIELDRKDRKQIRKKKMHITVGISLRQ